MELPIEFYEEEVRSGYLVSEKMKKIWAVELDLLSRFKEACEKNNLVYYMDGGTLLGAVRHKGFIPWDDDVDVIMPRKDYIKLCKIAHEEFEYPYFFQTTITENNFVRMHAQLRNSKTKGYILQDADKDINKGIFLDIFVLDGIPDDPKQKYWFKKITNEWKKAFDYRFNIKLYEAKGIKEKICWIVYNILLRIFPYKKMFLFFHNKVMGKYVDTEYVGDVTLKWRENVIWKREWYEGTVELEFENLILKAPVGYKDILEKQYGDYMKIPIDIYGDNGGSHGELYFSLDEI